MSTSLKRLFKVLLIFPTLGMGLYFLIEKGAEADQSFSLKFLQNYLSLIRDIFFSTNKQRQTCIKSKSLQVDQVVKQSLR